MLQLERMILSSRFEVQYRLRCGSYSELFLARNIAPRADEPEIVVIKALNVRLQGEPTDELKQLLIEGFVREAAALKECEHKNIIRLFDFGLSLDHAGREFYFLVLEYLAGGSLQGLLQSRKLNLQESLLLLGQVKDALNCIHQRGLVHRDIKPSNVMLLKNRRLAKLIDLGTIRSLDDPGQITEIGTPTYAAPEHYRWARKNGKLLTVAADVYAFAKTSYAVFTGQEPTEFKQLQINRLPQAVQAESWANGVLRVLLKATSDNPAERHQSVAEFFADLSEAIEITTYPTQTRRDCKPTFVVGKSRFVVEVTPLPKKPSRVAIVSARLSRLITLVRRVAWSLCLCIIDTCSKILRFAANVPGKLYAFVGAMVLTELGEGTQPIEVREVACLLAARKKCGKSCVYTLQVVDVTTDHHLVLINPRVVKNNFLLQSATAKQHKGLFEVRKLLSITAEFTSRVRADGNPTLRVSQDLNKCELAIIQETRLQAHHTIPVILSVNFWFVYSWTQIFNG